MDIKFSNKKEKPTTPTNNIETKIYNLENITDTPFSKDTIGIFIIKTANEWLEQAKLKPIPNMLFGEFWYENELCILFADTNLGKSILAVQIGNSISRGIPIDGIELEAEPQKVIYFDFELSDKQFENRYSREFSDHYHFNDNFYRIELDLHSFSPTNKDFESRLNESLEKTILETGSKILIIDNLTYLKSETENAKNALPLMRHLNGLKLKYGLSILALAHTPKRDLTKPIIRNDLQGSKMLMNHIDSSFTIGESLQDKHLRYLKQIKVRHKIFRYDAESVLNCEIQKLDNFLKFVVIGPGNEREHLQEFKMKDRKKLIAEVKELIEEGMSQRKIAKRLRISLGAVNKYSKL